MSRTPGILARLLGRGSTSPVVAQLHANVIGQPLLVQAAMGEQLLGAYLRGAVDARPPTMVERVIVPGARDETGAVTTMKRSVAVLNVSGGLANRYEGDFCDPGPLSYQELRAAFNSALADDGVEAIVLRIESPGGMASGCFDLADHIYASRGKKPIYASLDDYAYSAAFALASAADSIWITRTGGAGSVGVIAYHVDQSGWNAKVGIKVTAIYSGEHKNDMTPHAPLSDEVRAWLDTRMSTMRQLFADSVAKYRGMDVAAVLATEAQVYQGQDAIDVGFADRLGTFDQLIAQIAAGGADDVPAGTARTSDDTTGEPKASAIDLLTPLPENATADEVAAARAELRIATEVADGDAATIAGLKDFEAKLDARAAALAEKAEAEKAESLRAANAFAATIAASALPSAISLALIRRGPRADETAEQSIGYASKVRDLCFAAGIESVAADYIVAGTDIETARAQLIAAKAEDGPEISTHLPKSAMDGSAKPSPTKQETVYSRRRDAAAGTGPTSRQ